jgi:hypothetical protein
MALVTPSDTEPKYHFSLSDGTTELGFVCCDARGNRNDRGYSREPLQTTALKTYQGQGKYSDLEFPYMAFQQSDWSGGRGAESWDNDTTAFATNENCVMSERGVCLAPAPYYTFGYRNLECRFPHFGQYRTLTSLYRFVSYKFTAGATATYTKAMFCAYQIGSPGTLTFAVYTNSGGSPDTAIYTGTVTAATSTTPKRGWIRASFSSGVALTSGTTYHFVIYGAATDTGSNCWKVLRSTDYRHTLGDCGASSDGSSWIQDSIASSGGSCFFLYNASKTTQSYFFEYKKAFYCIQSYDDGTTPQLYINGDCGVVDSATSTTLVDGSKTWADDQWNNAVVILVEGTGSKAIVNYRTITDTVSSTKTITVSPAWDVTPSTDTVYSIVDSRVWSEITGHGLTVPITDVLVVNNLVYVAQGDSVNIRRMRFYNNSGTWTATYADDGTNKAGYLTAVPENGKMYIWKGTNGTPSSVAKAQAVAESSGSNLTFATAIACGDEGVRITNLIPYDDPRKLYVLKEDSFGFVSNDAYSEVPIDELKYIRSEFNGRGACVSDVYLLFGTGYEGGMQRYFKQTLINSGMDRGTGLTPDFVNSYYYNGYISQLVSHPGGKAFAALDGTGSNLSGVYMVNGDRWINLFIHPVGYGGNYERIRNVAVQVIPGSAPDKLWFNMDQDLMYMPLLTRLDKADDGYYQCAPWGYFETPWMFANMVDVYKYWKSLTLFFTNSSTTVTGYEINCFYKVDTGDATYIGTFDTQPSEEINLSSATPPSSTGKRMKLYFYIYNGYQSTAYSPRITATVVKAYGKTDVKYSYAWLTKLTESDLASNLEEQDLTLGVYSNVENALAKLDTWVDNATTLTMRSAYSVADNISVQLQPIAQRALTMIPDDQVEEHVIQIRVNET